MLAFEIDVGRKQLGCGSGISPALPRVALSLEAIRICFCRERPHRRPPVAARYCVHVQMRDKCRNLRLIVSDANALSCAENLTRWSSGGTSTHFTWHNLPS